MDPYVEEILQWRQARHARLLSSSGWLTLTGLSWLSDGEHRIGSDPSCEVVLPAAAPALAGMIVVQGGDVEFAPEPGPGAGSGGESASRVRLVDDWDGHPTVVAFGPISFTLIRRGNRRAIRIRDSDSPLLRSFRGMEYYPVEPTWRLVARFEAYPRTRKLLVPSVLGVDEEAVVPGALAFEVEGRVYRLTAQLERGETDLFIVFADLTNGGDTFAGGRYLYTSPPGPDGSVVLDFNRAYNPPCVFTPFATCTLPPPENHLPLPVTAGERRYRGPSAPGTGDYPR